MNIPPSERTSRLQDWIGQWLESQHDGYLVERVIDGSYGRVWILKHPNANPERFAAKSFRLQTESRVGGPDVQRLFEREIALWMRVPPHFNVLSALGVDLAPTSEDHHESGRIPIVRMPIFDESLRSWIDCSPKQNEPNCLVAIAQVCNGLGWLYAHGVSGHGDLKPENILVKDLRGDHSLDDCEGGIQSKQLSWRVVVADLGWANAWEALGLGDRAWRPYLAPERTACGFDARRSDSFAVGVILAELLTGHHPAGEPTERVGKWKPQRWRNWAEKGARKLDRIENSVVRSIVERCLSPMAEERPEPTEISRELAVHVASRFDIPFAAWQNAHNEGAQQMEALHPGWANEEMAKVSKTLRQEAVDDLRHRLRVLEATTSPESQTAAIWIVRSLAMLLSRGEELTEWREAYDLAVGACQRIVDGFDTIDWSGALIYVPKEMAPEEIALSVLNDLLDFLERVGGSDLPQVIAIRQRIRKLITEHENNADAI